MSTESKDNPLAELSRDEMMSALFANLVFQNTNMALMFLGHVPHPETKQKITDLEAARMFVDQLEMLEVKTKGNLSKDEERLLKESRVHVQMAFVEAVQSSTKTAPSAAPPGNPPPEAVPSPAGPIVSETQEEEARRRFSKKY